MIDTEAWVLVCELAAGYIDVSCGIDCGNKWRAYALPMAVRLRHLANNNLDLLEWAFRRLLPVLDQGHTLYNRAYRRESFWHSLGLQQPNSNQKLFEETERSAIICTELLNNENIHRVDLVTRYLNGHGLKGVTHTTLKAFCKPFVACNSIEFLNELRTRLDLLILNIPLRLSIIRHKLRRFFVWPLFYNGNSGLSFPIAIFTIPDGQNKIWCQRASTTVEKLGPTCPEPELIGSTPTQTTHIYNSLITTVIAAKETWRGKHGRLDWRHKDVVANTSVTFDFGLADWGWFLIGASGYLDQIFNLSQRSMESYVSSAIIARLLGYQFGDRTTSTGILDKTDPRTLAWAVTWTRNDKQSVLATVTMMMAKLRHAGRTGAYELFIVPAGVATTYEELRKTVYATAPESLVGVRSVPHVIGVTNLARCADLCLPGPWRPDRVVRCEHLLRSSGSTEAMSLSPAAAFPDVYAAFQRARKEGARGIFVNTTHGDYAASRIVNYLRAVNNGYLLRKDTQVPSRLGWLAYRAVEHEQGGAFFATLLSALRGRVSAAELARLDETLQSESSVEMSRRLITILNDWFNHTYSEGETWQSPEISLFYNIEHLRRSSDGFALVGGDPFDVWHTLIKLLPELTGDVCDSRHEPDFGSVRMIFIDASEMDTPELPIGWSFCDIRPALSNISEENITAMVPRFGSWLSLARIALPTAAAMSIFRAAGDLVAMTQDGRLSEPMIFASLLREATTFESMNPVYRSQGNFGIHPDLQAPLWKSLVDTRDIDTLTQLRMHLTLVGSLAPWLNVEELLDYRCMHVEQGDKGFAVVPVPVSSDEWFQPVRLIEINYHLHAARSLAISFRQIKLNNHGMTIEGLINQKLLVLISLQYLDRPARIRASLRYRTDATTALKEWQSFVNSLPGKEQGIRNIPFTLAYLGAKCWTSWLKFNERDEESRKKAVSAVRPIVNAMLKNIATDAPPDSVERAYMKSIARLFFLYLRCHESGSIETSQLDELANDILRVEKSNYRLLSAGEMFESIGDALFVNSSESSAMDWYLRGMNHSPNYSQCRIKYDAIVGTISGEDLSAWKRGLSALQQRPSRIPLFKDGIRPLIQRADQLLSELES